MKSFFKSISMLWAGSLAGAGFAFFTQVLLARALGPEELGFFSSALGSVMLLAPLAGFGVAAYWLKLFGREGFSAINWMQPSFRFVLYTTSIILVVLFMWAIFGPHEGSMKILLLILSFYIFGQVATELANSKLQLEGRYTRMAMWQFLPHFFRFIAVLAAFWAASGKINSEQAAWAFAVASILMLSMLASELNKMRLGEVSLEGHISVESNDRTRIPVMHVAYEAWPFGVAAFSQLIYYQSNIVILNYISGEESAGFYNAAFTIMAAIYLFPNILYQKFLMPKIHRWANFDRSKFHRVYKLGNKTMFALGVTAMIGVWAGSWWAIPLLFGEEYNETVRLTNILALSAPFIFVAFSAGSVLVTQDHMKKKVLYMGCVAVFNLVANIILISMLGAIGAAVSTVLSNMLLLTLYYLGAQRLVFANQR